MSWVRIPPNPNEISRQSLYVPLYVIYIVEVLETVKEKNENDESINPLCKFSLCSEIFRSKETIS